MRVNSAYPILNNLHWHNGSTCHGYNNFEEALTAAKKLYENCSILEVTDTLGGGQNVKCYSIIREEGEKHWKQHGKLITKLRLKAKITGRST